MFAIFLISNLFKYLYICIYIYIWVYTANCPCTRFQLIILVESPEDNGVYQYICISAPCLALSITPFNPPWDFITTIVLQVMES